MNPIQRLQLTLINQTPDRPPRGEVWIGPAVFSGAGLDDHLAGQIELHHRLGMDLLWLPVGTEERHCQGYRFFSPNDISRAKGSCDLFIGAVIDGPWQRLTGRMGLMELATALVKDREGAVRSLHREAEAAMALIKQCLAQGVDGLIVADDLAGQSGPLISPRDVDSILTPFYNRAGHAIRSSGSLALFHCCGNPQGLLDIWAKAGFQGLAAVQVGCLGLPEILKYFGPRPVLAAGLDGPVHFATDPPDLLISEADRMAVDFRLILSTSSGIHSWSQAERLMALYNLWP